MNQIYIAIAILFSFSQHPISQAIANLPITPPPQIEAPVSLPKILPKIAKMPLPDFKPLQTVQPIETANNPTNDPNAQSSTDNLTNSVVSGCGDNNYANYIYMHESGCSTTIMNAGGCLGIGQACPGSKLRNVCPNLDYACENGFFTAYANSAYGGWAGAYNFWLNHHWW